ncbi:cytochrome P450 [Streptomyces sp. ME19-01-6]|uniref:cytochrome P450 n=1 Tax=Streptomyces sp. ME19-01-6 TaxID=3028686 RepID=UPI0029A87CDF|nr:cytochrome P450 [Streptomyces sp. ME19-01-6]MDX3233969.1 cytochrome P450 [Streptomyces sp. ME19-01-6]
MTFDLTLQQLTQQPSELWEQVREERPVFYSDELNMWVVSRYEDVSAVLLEPNLFTSARSFDPAKPLPPKVEKILEGKWAANLMVNIDQPAHTPMRRAVNRALTHKRVENSVDTIRRIANELLDDLYPKGEMDLIARFARIFPALVVADILGLPADEVPSIIHWGEYFEEILAGSAPEEELLVAAQGLVDYQQYFLNAIEARLSEPRGDLLTAIAEEFVGNPELEMTMEEIADVPLGVFTAGHNTTTLAIGNFVFHMIEYPDHFKPLFDEHGKPSFYDAVDEMLRLETPFPVLRRRVERDTVVGGVKIPAGETVMLSLASANRDDAVFEGAGMLDLCRANSNRHLGFGAGIHFCPGKSLARREVSIAAELIYERLPNLAVGEYTRVNRFVNRGFSRLELTWDVA